MVGTRHCYDVIMVPWWVAFKAPDDLPEKKIKIELILNG